MRSTRYADTVCFKASSRTIIVTFFATVEKVHGCLGGGIAAANQIDVLASAKRGFTGSRAVINAGSYEAILVGKAVTMISDPCCTNCGACNELCAVGKITHALTSGKFTANSFAGEQDLCTEFAGLLPRSFGEFSTADAATRPIPRGLRYKSRREKACCGSGRSDAHHGGSG